MRGSAGPIWRCQGMQRVLNKIIFHRRQLSSFTNGNFPQLDSPNSATPKSSRQFGNLMRFALTHYLTCLIVTFQRGFQKKRAFVQGADDKILPITSLPRRLTCLFRSLELEAAHTGVSARSLHQALYELLWPVMAHTVNTRSGSATQPAHQRLPSQPTSASTTSFSIRGSDG